MSELFVLQTPLAELILLLIISGSISEALTAGDNSLLAGLISASTLSA